VHKLNSPLGTILIKYFLKIETNAIVLVLINSLTADRVKTVKKGFNTTQIKYLRYKVLLY